MLAALAPASFAPDRELEDARESLAYWETRAQHAPAATRSAAAARRARWPPAGRHRVAEAERLVYGRGLLGALLLLAAERRLPQRRAPPRARRRPPARAGRRGSSWCA